ncbi:rhodanese-like domain-containing protein [Roseateles koreensis]|uniref:Rhodanese-like domain-containing protein n=1 Tax=Roseateles koreensis TaxID=2987526 RepID=A0ABT5KNT5_9BURK|nr:rhodanese-like domain-containing protein [Roseateles koreensis]MDC8784573.1 rhodanese-like domain-containing protein [Roseateles koreensis]
MRIKLLLNRFAALAVLAWPLCGGAQPLSVVINPGDQAEQSRFAVFNEWKQVVEQSIRRERGAGLQITQSNDATADLSATRSRLNDLVVAPAHVVGSAVRYGYLPVATLEKPVQAVLVAPQSSAINKLSDAAGKRLGLPQQDSVVTYLLRGEVNAANSTIKKHFSAVLESRYQDALLVCLQIKRCDVVAVERAVFDRWQAAGEPVKAVMQSKAVPGLSLAIKPGSTLSVESLRYALVNNPASGLKLQAVAAEAFDYVATLGYFTPRALEGATLVDAPTVAKLMQGGAQLIDTRIEAEYKAGHAAGAKSVPYNEKSAKEADFKAEDDKFDLTQLPADKKASLVFACNGPECWKSFKASQVAMKAGYAKVYWFRGGFPEWRAAGYKIEGAP